MVSKQERMRSAYINLRNARNGSNETSRLLAEAGWELATMTDEEYLRNLNLCDCPELDNYKFGDKGLDKLLDDLEKPDV